MESFYLPPHIRKSITPEELALHVLQILKANDGGRYVGYYKFQLSSINAFEVKQSGEPYDKSFDDKFALAKHFLYHRGYIYKDPDQDSDDFVLLTPLGQEADTTQLVIGLLSTDGYIKRVELQTGPLDPTCKQYLEEAYSAACSEMYVTVAFMLGGAAERLLILLSRHIDLLLADTGASAKLAGLGQIRKIKEWCIDYLNDLKRKYPDFRQSFSDLEDKLTALYALYRYHRNDAGHPNDTPYEVDKATLKAMLEGFPTFAKSISKILAIPPLP